MTVLDTSAVIDYLLGDGVAQAWAKAAGAVPHPRAQQDFGDGRERAVDHAVVGRHSRV